MKFGLTKDLSLSTSACLVIGVLHNKPLPDFLAQLDEQHQGLFTRLLKKLTTAGDIAWQADINDHSLLMIDCGEEEQYSEAKFFARIDDIAAFLLKQRMRSATLSLPKLPQRTADWQVEQMVLRLTTNCYQLLNFKSKNNQAHALESVQFYQLKAQETAITTAKIIAQSIDLTRDLANFPANICTPTYLAEQANKLAKQHNSLHVNILNQDEMQKLGMNALLAVAKGSHEPPKLIEIQYQGADKNTSPIVLVGKGITFDSGGISLKPAAGMEEMKFDMAGAASVLGVLNACAALKLSINVVGLLACAENLPSGTATKPGDVVTGLSGQTIEIINTDAEGRLVLSDALTYAERFKPQFVIDIATLTGAVIIALGHINSGLMTQDDALAELILNAARESEDKIWRLPLEDAYQEAINSPIADIANSSNDRSAGSITAACFLSRFTSNYRWAHLDIAGSAWVSGKNRAATGRPVPLLIQLLRQLANSSHAH